MTAVGGTGLFKFAQYALIAVIIIPMVFGVINGLVVWNQTGNWKPLVDNSIGLFVRWDAQILEATNELETRTIINQAPSQLKQRLISFYQQSILINIVFFMVVGYALFKFGNWVVGLSQFSPVTDIFIVLSIILLFGGLMLLYSRLMHDMGNYPYQGIITLIRASIRNPQLIWGGYALGSETILNNVTMNVTQAL